MDRAYKSKIEKAFNKAVAALNKFNQIPTSFMSEVNSPESNWLAWECLTREGIDN